MRKLIATFVIACTLAGPGRPKTSARSRSRHGLPTGYSAASASAPC